MAKNDRDILEAASGVFMHYGIKKTTMSDVALAAGVARQTLYNAYPGKNELLRAVLQHMMDKNLQDILDGWKTQDSVGEKLQHYFVTAPLAWYDLIKASPDAVEMLEGAHETAATVLASSADRWKGAIGEMLEPHSNQLRAKTIQPVALADYIFSTSMNAKYGVSSRQELVSRLEILKASVLGLLA